MVPGSLAWFARHEVRLGWRDWVALITAGRRRRAWVAGIGFLAFTLGLHGLAYVMLAPVVRRGLVADRDVLVAITGTLAMVMSLMLAQAIEAATRAFYARGDLEFIMTSPAVVTRLFAVRIAGMAVGILIMTLVLAAPFIDMLAWLGGAGWLSAYATAAALAMVAVALGVVVVAALFRLIGPRRTRVAAQVVAAVVGGAFAIGVQFSALLGLNGGVMSRFAVLAAYAPPDDSWLLLPARAAFGDAVALVMTLGASVGLLALAIALTAPRFGRLVLAASNASTPIGQPVARSTGRVRWRSSSPAQALRHKEWRLLLRDPWLLSQTLMQLLYLLPVGFMLWHNFYSGGATSGFLVPILVVTAGQLGGGLAWLAVSAEDAPELIATAPVVGNVVMRAKAAAVLGGIGVIFGPFLLVLAVLAPGDAVVALGFVVVAAISATAIQYWFRTQVKRSAFRRRQTSSRIATVAEALSSTGWAGTAAMAASGSWAAVVPAMVMLAVLGGVWMVSPSRE